MTDIFDQASLVEEQTLQGHLQAQRLRAAAGPKVAPSGECQNPRCAEEFDPGDNRIYCNSRCADEHQRLTRN